MCQKLVAMQSFIGKNKAPLYITDTRSEIISFSIFFLLLCSRKYTARKLTQLHVFFTRGKILTSPAVVTC